MSSLFSHPSAADVPEVRPELTAVVTVPAPVDHAWAGLTEHLHLWWPADELSRWGADSFFDLEDNALVETSADEDENVWGEVMDSRPGQWLELRWTHLGSASTTVVRLTMTRGGVASPGSGGDDQETDSGRTGTTLALVHHGWSTVDPQDLYEFYRDFWPDALACYRRFMGGS
ncbi:SRPBCC family protein [Arthrobacter sp. MDT1-65]